MASIPPVSDSITIKLTAVGIGRGRLRSLDAVAVDSARPMGAPRAAETASADISIPTSSNTPVPIPSDRALGRRKLAGAGSCCY